MRFDGKVALVTGAGKGIGRAYAEYFAERGASVVVNNRTHPDRPSSAEEVASAIRAKGGKAVADGHAVQDKAGSEAMVETAYQAFGRLDILVNNAAISIRKRFEDMSDDEIEQTLSINLFGTLYPTRAALPRMKKDGYGRIVFTTSSAGLYGQMDLSMYGASKTALIGLARGISIENRDWDLGVNIISPYARTDMAKAIDAKFSELLHPTKVAKVVGWLCHDSCKESGVILAAGSGRVRRVRTIESPIAAVPENGDAAWERINVLEGGYEPSSAVASALFLTPEIKGGEPPV